MMIRTTRVFAPGTLLHLDLEATTRHLLLQGRVIWARAGGISWLATGKIGMGVKFVDPPDNLMGLLFPPKAGGAGA
jgi:Tfp pilus assembly protein PilZ